MSTELRFLVAIGLMVLVLAGTNILFPPIPEEPPATPEDSAAVMQEPPTAGRDTAPAAQPRPDTGVPSTEPPAADPAPDVPDPGSEGVGAALTPATDSTGVPERVVRVEGPLYRYAFSTLGARLESAELLQFRSLRRDGPVELIPEATSALGHRVVVGRDTIDLRRLPFRVDRADDLTLVEGGAAERLTFVYEHPTSSFRVELTYVFEPDSYLVGVEGEVQGVDRPLVVTEMGEGLAYNEADSTAEARMMAYVGNHLQDGIDAYTLDKVEEREVREGPFVWAAFKSKFFVLALLPAREGVAETTDTDYLGSLIVEPAPGETSARLAVTQPVGANGLFDYQVFVGPLEYARLSSLGDDLEEVNPYGWRFFRPIIRPFVSVIMTVLNFLHDKLNIGYGWVLILFGVLMRLMLWPLYMKSMRAQMNNMAVQPLLKEIQEKYKDQPEKLQKEMMKLYKEYGFNPLAGCLPMLLPWPILIALFFVFQNTIELRGVEFLWLPDLSAADPYYILPLFLALSMFLLQFISYRSMDGDNPQMKMMMWIMPFFFGFIFMNFASGLNLYYATANVSTIPQQLIVAKERKRAKARGPVKRTDDE